MTDQRAEWREWLRTVDAGMATAEAAHALKDPGNRAAALRHIAPSARDRAESAERQRAVMAVSQKEIDREFCWFGDKRWED